MENDQHAFVLKAVKVLHDYSDREDEEIVQHLIKAGMSQVDAEKTVVFVPIAFGRALLLRLGANGFSKTFVVKTARGDWIERPFSAESIFCSAFAVAVAQAIFEQGVLSREEFQSVATRSPELNAANKALWADADIKNGTFSPPALIRLMAEDFSSQDPNMDFKTENNWAGGHYELAIEIGERSDDRLYAALKKLWEHENLDGCYLVTDKEPQDQIKLIMSRELINQTNLFGLARMPNSHKIVCGSCIIRFDEGIDWISLFLPMGALGNVYDVGGYPFGPYDNLHQEWQKPIDTWLKKLCWEVYSAVPFKLALIGYEVLAEISINEILGSGIPSKRFYGILLESNGRLQWLQKNS